MDISIAAVCGNEVRIYDVEPSISLGMSGKRPYPAPYNLDVRRPLLRVLTFSSHGAAKAYAQEYEEAQRGRRK